MHGDAKCTPCSGKPVNSIYTSAGDPFNVDSCEWACEEPYYLVGGRCLPPNVTCTVGQYKSGWSCEQCSADKPAAHAHWTTPGIPIDKDNCGWSCDAGYIFSDAANECQLAVRPAISVLVAPNRDLSESGLFTQISFKTSTVPKCGWVKLVLFPDAQINVSVTTKVVNLTSPDFENVGASVIIQAVDDQQSEGTHGGVLTFSVKSCDPEYDALEISPLWLKILDNDCPALSIPSSATFLDACDNRHGYTCTVQCRPGYLPSSPTDLLCSQETSHWNRDAPMCDDCDVGFFKSGQSCFACTNVSCPAGHYRLACQKHRDGSCSPCTNQIPRNARYSGSGIPFDANNCDWSCESGYFFFNQTCMLRSVPTLVVSEPQDVSESIVDKPINLDVRLATPPASNCFVSVYSDVQLNITAGSNFTFSPSSWQKEHTIRVAAYDDSVVEGLHSGVLTLQVSCADEDPNWNLTTRISITIMDNDCRFIPAPSNGRVILCGTTVGEKCIYECNAGFFPSSPVVRTCLQTRMWSNVVPECENCLPGFWKSGSTCTPCSSGPCAQGMYRSACRATEDSQCVPCSTKPPYSRYVSPGRPIFSDACSWKCEVGHYHSKNRCIECSNSSCPPGNYREQCLELGRQVEDSCLQCDSNELPTNGRWIGSTNAYICKWACNSGFTLTSPGFCGPTTTPEILLATDPIPRLKEATPSSPKTVDIRLSEAPTSDVTIDMTTSEQIDISSASQLTFTTSNWNEPKSITVIAIDDRVYEGGDHTGLLSLTPTSLDLRWNTATMSPISLIVEDNDCNPLAAPRNGMIQPDCSNEYGGVCSVKCDAGRDPSQPVVLKCLASTRDWDKPLPECKTCASSYYKQGRDCMPCSSTSCGVGLYRGTCGSEKDSKCELCTNKPVNAFFTSSGQPWNADNCTWNCASGFWKSGVSCIPCSTGNCPTGKYRGPCNAIDDATCFTCNNSLPEGAQYSSFGNSSGYCPFECSVGYHMDETTTSVDNIEEDSSVDLGDAVPVSDEKCVPNVRAGLIVTGIMLDTGEDSFFGKTYENARFSVALTKAPTQDVRVDIDPLSQFASATPSYLVFKAADSGRRDVHDPQIVSLKAKNDGVRESPTHVGVVKLLPSTRDPLYASTQDQLVYVNIVEDECPPLAESNTYFVGTCNNSICELCCRANMEPEPCHMLECLKNSNSESAWVGSAPNCTCKSGFFRNESVCQPCVSAPCPIGQYRGPCQAPSGGQCVNCTSPVPANAHYSTAGRPYNANICSWRCNEGFVYDNTMDICHLSQVPNEYINVNIISSSTSEDPSSAPAEVLISLSAQPSATVSIQILMDVDNREQLIPPSELAFSFDASNWNVPVRVLLHAFDDRIWEGTHSGEITLILSTADNRFQEASRSVVILIMDNDCPPLTRPINGQIIPSPCTVACTVLCLPGYGSTGPINLTCNTQDGTWDNPLPDCRECSVGYFRTSQMCVECSRDKCPLGQYRARCHPNVGASCTDCTNKPRNSHYVGGGDPYNLDSCPWECDENHFF